MVPLRFCSIPRSSFSAQIKSMTPQVDLPTELALFVLALCWLGFGAILVVGKRGAEKSTKRQDFKSHAGFFLQCLGYAICFSYGRKYFSPILRMSQTAEWLVAAFAALIAIASTWFCFAAARALGKHWALVARVIEGHELIRRGPYAVVRNPIYLAMLGMLIATGLIVSKWQSLAVATIVFMIGTEIRIRSEEKLLRAALGRQFDEYAAEVPAFIPRVF
jgi:protein-S-isoprenylcysteine O-methyltransferase Ste14